MFSDFYDLEEALRDFCPNGRAYFVQPPGNLGDALIRAGSLRMFRTIGLEIKELPPRKILTKWLVPLVRGGPVIFGGGGAWCRNYSFSARMVGTLARRFRVLVLPSTFECGPFPDDVTFFARDRAQSLENCPKARFCHDMAFYLGRIEAPPGRGVLDAFREDVESAMTHRPPGNIDVSAMGNQRASIARMFEVVARYEQINTDRLHVAIAGSLLGRRVNLYGSNYFKSRAIFDASIRGVFPNTQFINGCGPGGVQGAGRNDDAEQRATELK